MATTIVGRTDIEGWIPYELQEDEGQLTCYWLDARGQPFIEPLFDQTIVKCRAAYNNRIKYRSASSLGLMEQWAESFTQVLPAAFILHISRCGSTLVSQLLASSPKNISLAEVPLFDDILMLPFKQPDITTSEIGRLLNAAIKYHAYGITESTSFGEQKPERLFIKADSWHIFFYEQLRSLFPETPFILMYRSPDEVFRSLRKQAGMQAVPGMIEPELFGFDKQVIEQNPEVYLANVLALYLSKYLEIAGHDKRCMLLNYNEGPMQIIHKIAAFARVNFSERELAEMTQRSQYHSKKPNERFNEPQVTGFPPCLNGAMELYHKLEKKRFAMQ